jgi:hypothetical protein
MRITKKICDGVKFHVLSLFLQFLNSHFVIRSWDVCPPSSLWRINRGSEAVRFRSELTDLTKVHGKIAPAG